MTVAAGDGMNFQLLAARSSTAHKASREVDFREAFVHLFGAPARAVWDQESCGEDRRIVEPL